MLREKALGSVPIAIDLILQAGTAERFDRAILKDLASAQRESPETDLVAFIEDAPTDRPVQRSGRVQAS